jgi:hypothetical protein
METLQDTAGKQYHCMTYPTWLGYMSHDLMEIPTVDQAVLPKKSIPR